MTANKIQKLLEARANLIDPSHAPHAPALYRAICRRSGLNEVDLDRLYARSGNNIVRLATYLKAQSLLLITSAELRAACRTEGRLPCVIFLNQEIRRADSEFSRLT